ncbi:MAG: hypothetical protein HYZ77_03845 [Serratia liquefaciens]|nr:hypothetical protein [Serratia liquefaciens]
MSTLKFIEIVGNASTAASIGTRKLGHNVNAAAYERDDKIVLQLESNGSRASGTKHIEMTKAEYEEFCAPQSRPLFVRGIELFGAEVWL